MNADKGGAALQCDDYISAASRHIINSGAQLHHNQRDQRNL